MVGEHGEQRKLVAKESWSEPARGRKECPACTRFVGAPVNVCVCGWTFEKKEKEEKVVVATEERRPATKQCPKCERWVHTRSSTCAPPCDHVFTRASEDDSAAAAEKRQKIVEKTRRRSSEDDEPAVQDDPEDRKEIIDRRITVHAMEGPCPIPLESTSRLAVRTWGLEVREHFANYHLGHGALIQYARQFYAWGSPDFETVRETIRTLPP